MSSTCMASETAVLVLAEQFDLLQHLPLLMPRLAASTAVRAAAAA